jgi:hypothetical protein
MPSRRSSPSSAPSSVLRPARVLLHPLWLGATLVLALNDHWLKHADMLPSVLTGKLSDFAGMLVAPALFAALLGVRTRRGWWLAHLAVGSVFAALQLSPACATLWSTLMAAFAFPWQVTSDPTDLLALPLLLVSLCCFAPAMTTASLRLARRSAEAGAAGVGLLCCVATSRAEPGEWLPDLDADVWLHNGTDAEQVIRIRELRAEIALDCDAVRSDPARLLPLVLFDTVQSWTVPADANVAVIEPDRERAPCHAAIIDADDVTPVLLFWDDGVPPVRTIAGSGSVDGEGAIELLLDLEDRGHFEGSAELLFTALEHDDASGECAVQDDADRVDWGDEVPIGEHRVVAVVPGVDGCTAIDVLAAGDEGGDATRMYLCTPTIELPFAAGDDIAVRREYGISAEAVVLALLDESLAPVQPATELWVSRGAGVPALPGLEIGIVPLYGCDWSPDPCGAAVRAVSLAIGSGGGQAVQLRSGAATPTLTGDDGDVWEVALAHAQERAVLDAQCSAGPDALGYDIELVAVRSGAGE